MNRLIHPTRTMATLRLLVLAVMLATMLGSATTLHAQDRRDTPAERPASSDDDQNRDDDHDRRGSDRDRPGPPPPFYGPPRHQPLETPLDEERVQHILNLMEEMDPGSTDRLLELREEHPDRFEGFMSHVGPHVLYMNYLHENDPPAYKLRRQEHELGIKAMRLGHRARTADDEAEKQAHREELREVLDQQFEVRTQLLEHEMGQLERRLDHLREQVAEQRDNRERFVDRRLEMILDFRGRDRRGPRDDDDRRHEDRDDDRTPRSDDDDTTADRAAANPPDKS